MTKKYQAIRGMSDIIPEQTDLWQYVENSFIDLLNQYQYQQIRFPIVEKTELFSRTIGEVTDIVEKEMYVFDDRNGDSLALRPEGTAGCVRACIENSLLNRNTQKLWYVGPMFRHERPQKGRYRQFHQFGVEAFGFSTPDIDAEMIMLTYQFWKKLGLLDSVVLQINSLGSSECRKHYKNTLVEYYQQHIELLDEDSKRRLTTNPLRILDSKAPQMQALNANAPKLSNYLDDESQQDFEALLAILDTCNIPYQINPCLVRGLDYYCKTVFEWVTDKLGAQGTICAGGRYDGLVEQLGGVATPAIGFAMGLERIITLLQDMHFSQHHKQADVFFITLDKTYQAKALAICDDIRSFSAQMTCYYQPGAAGLKNQMKKADKSGALLAMILGEDEFNSDTVTIKFLREQNKQQASLAISELPQFLDEYKRSYHG